MIMAKGLHKYYLALQILNTYKFLLASHYLKKEVRKFLFQLNNFITLV